MRRSVWLAMGFAGLLVVIGGSSLAVWRNTTAAQVRVSNLHESHLELGAALAAIRANVYRTAILTRDYLLETDPSAAPAYETQFNVIQERSESALKTLEAAAQDAEQKAAIQRLRQELVAYWDPTELMLDWTPEEKQARRLTMLKQRVKRRQEVFQLAGNVEKLMNANFVRERERITSADHDFRASLGWTTAFALLLGVTISVATLIRLRHLELQSQAAESQLRLLSGQIRTAQEEERRYLSRELHDQVGQMLTGLRMELAGMARLLADSQSEISLRIARAKGTVEQTSRIVRNIAMLLRPSMLDDLGLSPALAWLIKEVERSSGIEVRSEIDAAVDTLPDAHRTCLYRLVQEALTNASRHSGAHSAEVTIRSEPRWVACTIRDNGRGFDMAVKRGASLGLLGMEERVRELGGTIKVTSALGQGTRVEVRLPCPTSREEHDDSSSDRGRSRDRTGRIETSA